MGRKSAASTAKSKEKRLQRKEEQQRITKAMAVVGEANNLVDPLEAFPVFRAFNKNGLTAHFSTTKGPNVDENTKAWAFQLTKKNMQLKYEQCSWGWDEEKKLEELSDENAWFLIARSPIDNTPIGFSHFRFDMDEGIEVLYCYELQLEIPLQRKGLGKFMMQILELVAFKNNMKKVVLTVLKNNQNSKFFKAIGYELDESSPIDDEEESYPYEILSKINKRLAPTLPLISTTTKHPSHSNGHSHGHSHLNGHCHHHH